MSDGNEIAIIGMSGRFPGCASLGEFWRNLADGVELIRSFSEQELLDRGVDPALVRDPTFVRAAASLDDMERFDASFFGFLPREAQLMDPQHRMLLECSWEALEDAGYDSERVAGPVGLYAGVAMNGYLVFHLVNNPAVASAGYVAIQLASDKDYMPSRISYKLDLRGPSCLIQAACSTSLVALHVACQSLLSHECDMALAGGASVLVHNRFGYQHVEGGIFSPDGHCRSFDAGGRGTVFGSGVGVVVVKRLADAIAHGDNVLAVIRGSAVNNDGAAKVGYTAPSVDGQAQVVAEALANAGVSAESISYVEGHGTATQLGDPIEVQALIKAFRASTRRQRFCALGSIKSNLGHLDAAAGIAGVIKSVLALRHRKLPPTVHYRTPNPRVDWDESPFFVNDTLRDWTSEGPRRAGVSSFGIGGTNAHLILEEAPDPKPQQVARPAHLLLLSARTPSALAASRVRLADHLEQTDTDLAHVAYTLQNGRRTFEERMALVVGDRAAAVRALRSTGPDEGGWQAREERRDRPVTFLYPGQGAQYGGMARELYTHEPMFRKELDRCATLLERSGIDLLALLYPTGGAPPDDLRRTELAQPALFAVEYALTRMWAAWGVVPDAMIGHSLGEYVAACTAGVFSLEDALKLVALRGRLTSECPPGAMLSVALSERRVAAALTPDLALAAVNGPESCVVAGPQAAVDRFEASLGGVRCRRLEVSHAFHSPMLAPMVERFAEVVRSVTRNEPRGRWISNVTGTWITPQRATDPEYWVEHLVRTVRFADGVTTLLADPDRVWVEVGPGQALTTFVRAQRAGADGLAVTSLRGRSLDGSDVEHLLRAVGRLWLGGVTVDWSKFGPKANRRRTSLPTYPFERERHWVDAVSTPWVVAGRPVPPPGHAAPGHPAPVPSPVAPAAPASAVPTDLPDSAVRALLVEQLNILTMQVEVLRQRGLATRGARHVARTLAEPAAADPREVDQHLQRDVRSVERPD